jgi:DNA topoisomerase IA
VSSVFGEEYLSPMKKIPAPKNTTMIETEETGVAGEEKKKSKKDLVEEKKAEKDKDNAAPKNAQNAHEAIRPSETDGKVIVPAWAGLFA